MITLYTATTSNGRRATIMLEECGLPYTAHKVNLAKGADRPAELYKISPQGTIPAIVDDQGPGGKSIALTQSGAIALYLAEKTGRFLPADPIKKATTLQWFMHAITDVGPASGLLFTASMGMENKIPAFIDFAKSRLLDQFKLADQQLGTHEYLTGELSIADFAYYPIVAGRKALLDESPGLNHIRRWAAMMAARPAIERAMKVAA